MAQVDANKIIDALAIKLARTIVEATINEIALAELEQANEPGDIPRDEAT